MTEPDARDMETRPQWEYKQVQIDLALSAESMLCGLGVKGWELVSVDNGQAYLKRKLPPPKTASGMWVAGRMR